jgi:hypothetical protein
MFGAPSGAMRVWLCVALCVRARVCVYVCVCARVRARARALVCVCVWTRTGTRVASAVLRLRRPTAAPWALARALHHQLEPLSAAKGSPPPRPPTVGDRSQGHTRPDINSAARPGCRGLWLVKRQAAPDQQPRVGRPRHTAAADSLSGRIEAEPSPSPAGCMRAFAQHVPA